MQWAGSTHTHTHTPHTHHTCPGALLLEVVAWYIFGLLPSPVDEYIITELDENTSALGLLLIRCMSAIIDSNGS